MNIRAIITGASGMVGEGVLLTALNHPDVETVLVLGRRTCGVQHPKLKEILHSDFFDLSKIEFQLSGYNACYFCLGVSSVGLNEQQYARTTYKLTVNVATTLLRLNSEMTFCYVSGTGTDGSEQGALMWARIKGKTENHLMQLPFKGVYCFRPGLMKPAAGQKNVKPIFKVLASMYALLKFLSPKNACTLEDLGRSMISVTEKGYSKKILENRDIDLVGQME